MAQRPLYIPSSSKDLLVETIIIDFDWIAGRELDKKQDCILALHSASAQQADINSILEVSSKSHQKLGSALSAFNLSFQTKQNRNISLESLYHSSKVFQKAGPFKDILYMDSLSAKRDYRLKSSGELIAFESNGTKWDLEPKTMFYDWIYLNVLMRNEKLHNDILKYDAFTDIEFNPKRSINCQAYSVALFKRLMEMNDLDKVLQSHENYKEFIGQFSVNNAYENTAKTPNLF